MSPSRPSGGELYGPADQEKAGDSRQHFMDQIVDISLGRGRPHQHQDSGSPQIPEGLVKPCLQLTQLY